MRGSWKRSLRRRPYGDERAEEKHIPRDVLYVDVCVQQYHVRTCDTALTA